MKKLWLVVFTLTMTVGALFAQSAASKPAAAAEKYRSAGGDVKFQFIGRYDIERLNRILTTERAEFSSIEIQYPAASNPVDLYKVVYTTVIPEESNRPTVVSGLIAVPQVSGSELPMLSYQHGTVFSRNEVPSSIEDSAETRLAIACFAAQGYIVAAADYVGKGVSSEPDGWLVKECTTQTCFDMLFAARAVCTALNITPGKLFLSGWSQGSFNTAALLHRLEKNGIPVEAAAMASAPNDIYLAVNRWIHAPSPLDVDWLVGAASLLIQSYENYYGLSGLASEAIKPQYLEAARDLYANRISWTEAAKKLPSKVKDLLTDEFIRQGTLANSRFFRRLQLNSSYHWRFATPVVYYYGDLDEVMSPYMVQLPVEYQKTLGGASTQAVSAGKDANHRGTFVFGLADQKARFDAMLKPAPSR